MQNPAGGRIALLSVSDKTGIVEFARALVRHGYTLASTGGTAEALSHAGLAVTSVSSLTGFPEMMEGRVKTLHPAVHGGILADRSKPSHMTAMTENGFSPIDVVCVNLYPFASTVAREGVELAEAVENIDIGGPAMIRSAAKNHASVTVIVDPSRYELIAAEMEDNEGSTLLETRRSLAADAYAHTGRYDANISTWLRARFAADSADTEVYPDELALGFARVQNCRYGENPHQTAAFYAASGVTEPCVSTARQVHGKELSYNNIYDLNAALEAVKEFSEESGAAAVIVKHTNPCGAALAGTPAEAFLKARLGDPVSAYGGILALTVRLDAETAEQITGKDTFFEAIIAPGFDEDALPILTGRKKWGANLRLLEVGSLQGWRQRAAATGPDFKRVVGGLLVQTPDHRIVTSADLTVATDRAPTDAEIDEMLFAWRIVRHVKSNAIVFTNGNQVIGVGAGQMNRVRSVRLAVEQAGEAARGAVMASDAFFPFPDGPEAAAEAGITAIIQPGGSLRDKETIAVANKYGIAMVLTGVRHFLH